MNLSPTNIKKIGLRSLFALLIFYILYLAFPSLYVSNKNPFFASRVNLVNSVLKRCSSEPQDFYSFLGVSREATPRTILRKCMRKIVGRAQAGKTQVDNYPHHQCVVLVADMLLDAEDRGKYDKWLKEAEARNTKAVAATRN